MVLSLVERFRTPVADSLGTSIGFSILLSARQRPKMWVYANPCLDANSASYYHVPLSRVDFCRRLNNWVEVSRFLTLISRVQSLVLVLLTVIR